MNPQHPKGRADTTMNYETNHLTPKANGLTMSVSWKLFCYSRPIWRKYPLTMPNQTLFRPSYAPIVKSNFIAIVRYDCCSAWK